MQQTSRQDLTELEGFVDAQNLSKREQRIREAVLYYHIEDLTQAEIAQKIGVTRQTVSGYLNSEEAEQFEPFLSSKKQTELKEWLERQLWKAYTHSNEALEQIKNQNDASPQTRVQASRELMKNQDRLVKWLQEVGLIDKQPDKEIHQEAGPAEVNINIEEVTEDDLEQEEEATKA